jgi:predicted Zn-ribbon and HTH transcriptional regulator
MSSTTKRPTRKTRCPGCKFEWNTRANGYSVTCVRCQRAHYVPRAVDPLDQLAARPRRKVTCRACGHWFTTRARVQSATKCPECRASVWVPLAAPVAPIGPEFSRQRTRDPEPVWWDDDDQDDDDQDDAPAGAGTVVGTFSRFLSGLLAPPVAPAPAPIARPAPAPIARPVAVPRQTSPRPVYPGFARPGPTPATRPGQRERLYGMPVWPIATRRADRCALVSAHRDDEQCRGGADMVADVAGRQFVVCEGHGYAIQRADALGQVPPLS